MLVRSTEGRALSREGQGALIAFGASRSMMADVLVRAIDIVRFAAGSRVALYRLPLRTFPNSDSSESGHKKERPPSQGPG